MQSEGAFYADLLCGCAGYAALLCYGHPGWAGVWLGAMVALALI